MNPHAPATPRLAMLRGLTVLLGCQFAGQLISSLAHLPLPGPLVGLLLLLAWLSVRGGVASPLGADIDQAATGLLRYLGLFFVPAGAGIVTQLDVIGHSALAIAVALVVSALLGLAVTAGLMQWLDRNRPAPGGPPA